jgi:hypothetical protein
MAIAVFLVCGYGSWVLMAAIEGLILAGGLDSVPIQVLSIIIGLVVALLLFSRLRPKPQREE